MSYNKQSARLVQMVKALSHKALGPGFDSQVPHFIHIFCFNLILCSSSFSVHHTLTIQARHMAIEGNPRVLMRRVPWAPVNAYVRGSERSKEALKPMGLIAELYLQFGDRTPMGLLFSFFFHIFLFYLFCLIFI